MIDIHCHLLYGVDDGPPDLETSLRMLKEAQRQGITDIILTPHYRRGMFRFDKERVIEHKHKIEAYAHEVGIRLYLGTEIHVNGDILEYLRQRRVLPLANSEHVLTEYEYGTEYSYIFKMTQELLRNGYIPIIAHVERYECLLKEPKLLEELQEIGAYTQCNAQAILGDEGFNTKQFCKKALKNGWVDFVASDSHDLKHRACYLKDAFRYIEGKYGEKLAHKLMVKNPEKIIFQGTIYG